MPTVAFYMLWDDEQRLRKGISGAFPDAQWRTLESPLEPGSVKAYECLITAADIEKRKQPLLNYRQIQGDFGKGLMGILVTDWISAVLPGKTKWPIPKIFFR